MHSNLVCQIAAELEPEEKNDTFKFRMEKKYFKNYANT